MSDKQAGRSAPSPLPEIPRRRLGRTEIRASVIGLGLWGMSGWSGRDDERSAGVLRRAVDLDCNFFDTAWAYGDGNSDRLLGSLHQELGAAPIYMASKVPPLNARWPARASDSFKEVFPRDYVMGMVEQIRVALGVEAVPLLQLHVWDDQSSLPKARRGAAVRRIDRALWSQPQSLGAVERPCCDPDRSRRFCAGHLQHLRSSTRG